MSTLNEHFKQLTEALRGANHKAGFPIFSLAIGTSEEGAIVYHVLTEGEEYAQVADFATGASVIDDLSENGGY